MILRARTVLADGLVPIDNGAVGIDGGRLSAVGKFQHVAHTAGGAVVDLGDVVLFPGLVNAHCHLDYTDMAGLIPPQQSFTEWIKAITGLKGAWGYSEFAASWAKGASMLLHSGTTTVGDIEAVPELPGDLWPYTPLRMISFFEMTGVRSRRSPVHVFAEAVQAIGTFPRIPRKQPGLSPHALYSTTPGLIQLAVEGAHRKGWRRCTHVAESNEEFQMFTEASGVMFDWLRRNGRDLADCGACSPVQLLARLGALGPDLLAVHANYLRVGDARRLAESGTSVVHCPRSHAYFEHQPFPFEELTGAGVNVCLGTDSLATTRRAGREPLQLDLRAEMRLFANRHPHVSPADVLAMATRNGARALGLDDDVGTLRPGAAADAVAVPFNGSSEDAVEAVIHHRGRVHASLIAGEWALAPSDVRA